jgi:hypothetical protein
MKRSEVDKLYGDWVRASRLIEDELQSLPLQPDPDNIVTREDGAQLVAVPCPACAGASRHARRRCKAVEGDKWCNGRGYVTKWMHVDDAADNAESASQLVHDEAGTVDADATLARLAERAARRHDAELIHGKGVKPDWPDS